MTEIRTSCFRSHMNWTKHEERDGTWWTLDADPGYFVEKHGPGAYAAYAHWNRFLGEVSTSAKGRSLAEGAYAAEVAS